MNYEIIFESEIINFIKLTEKLVQDYLDMVNDIEVQKFISYNRKTYELDGLELNVYNFNPRGIRCYEIVGFIKDEQGKTDENIHMKISK